MVSYQEWTSILFDLFPEAEATRIIQVAGREWSAKKEALKDATKAEAREYAKRNL